MLGPGLETVTFVLTEVLDSVALWERDADAMQGRVAELDGLVGDLVLRHGGTLVKPRGEGDSHFLVFRNPSHAVAAALELARATQGPDSLHLRVAVHTGPAEFRDGDWYGPTVNLCARVRGACHGGQVGVTAATASVIGDELPPEVTLHPLGPHHLKDLARPVDVLQLCHPDLDLTFPPLTSLPLPGHGLPLPPDELVGRSNELDRLLEVSRRVSVLTITGPPGAGKSRLGLELAARLYEEGSRVLHRSLATGRVPADVEDEADVVVLDDVDAVDDVTAAIGVLRGPPHLVILTSRRPTGVEDEQTWTVPPLVEDDAVALFLDRAPRPPSDRDLVAAICRRLHLLPLAIELAAARTLVLSAGQLLERLDDPDRVLIGSPRTRPAHHRSFRAAVDWPGSVTPPA